MGKSRLYGDWNNIMPRLAVLQSQVGSLTVNKMRELAEQYNKAIVEHIDKQDLVFPALAEKTIKLKGHSMWWVDTEYFKNHLAIEEIRGKQKVVIRVGALDTVKYPGKQAVIKTMYDLAVRLEYGWGHIPARPLFTKTLEKLGSKMQSAAKELNGKFQGLWK
jgi:hypothetical protein